MALYHPFRYYKVAQDNDLLKLPYDFLKGEKIENL